MGTFTWIVAWMDTLCLALSVRTILQKRFKEKFYLKIVLSIAVGFLSDYSLTKSNKFQINQKEKNSPCKIYFYLLTLLSSFPLTLLAYYPFTILPFTHLTLLPFYSLALLLCCPFILLPSYPIALLPYWPSTLLPFYPLTLLLSCPLTLLTFFSF